MKPLFTLLFALTLLLPFGFIGGGLYAWLAVPGQESLGLIWVACGALVLVVYLAVFGSMLASGARAARIRRDGIAATATVVALADTGAFVNRRPVMRIDLEVQPPDALPYAHSLRTVVPLSLLGQLRPGSTLAVHVARNDRSSVVLEDPSRLVVAA